ncbi:hypothetical protein UPYG_G00161720 [Umbra pygmaea]|uniref:Quattro n=1 Tax=Umbra pygmaea TaxID=75934 RepID=A0ABD0XC59_UMBPY
MMNPESLDSSIQGTLSALFPPFEATAPIVLTQLFRTIEECYQGDALHCLLDFLIPSKHLLESVQQAACAPYSDVLFRCEGWPLCLRDRTVIQLAPLNPLLLRPGDFYLQVEPFGEQASRIVLKSLLEEGCREVEETPVPETSYPGIFTLDWLREVNDGRHGTPLSRCLLSTDHGVVKVPWAQVAIPEFLDKPKTMAMPIVTRHIPFQPSPLQIPSSSESTSSALSLETMILPGRDGISVSLRLMDGTSKVIKGDHEKNTPKPRAKPLIKPVGWVSPNTWDTSRNHRELEGDYVDLVEFSKEKQSPVGSSKTPKPSPPPLFKPVRPPPPVPLGNISQCGRTLRFSEEPCTPCSQRKLGHVPDEQELTCRYRDSYLAALRNPVPFERGGSCLVAGLEDVGPCKGEESSCKGHAGSQVPSRCFNHYVVRHDSNPPIAKENPFDLVHTPHKPGEPSITHKQGKHCEEHHVIHKLCQLEPQFQELQTNQIAPQTQADSKVPRCPMNPRTYLAADACEGDITSKVVWNPDAVKTIGKHRGKLRSLSTVSDKARGSPRLHERNNRSNSDVCKETVSPSVQVIPCKKKSVSRQESPELELQQPAMNGKDQQPVTHRNESDAKHQSTVTQPSAPPIQPHSPVHRRPPSPPTQDSIFRSIVDLLHVGLISLPGSRDRAGRAVLEVYGDRPGWTSTLLSTEDMCKALLYLHSIPRKDVRSLGLTVVIDARKKPPPAFFYKALLIVQEQALHVVHAVVLLVDKDTSPRPERHTGLQMDLLTSMKGLHKLVEGRQLTFDLGGTFPYSHTDWLQFHQKWVSFLSDLEGAGRLLQRAIQNIEGNPKMDTVQDVQLVIQNQKTSMKEVLQDARLVTLQREGGAILARMRREEFRFNSSVDYRDALDSATQLYNQVEESVHKLVMSSNESLQHLDLLLKVREAESVLNTARAWFHEEGEQQLMDCYPSEDSLDIVKQCLLQFYAFLTQAKEKKLQTLTHVMEVEKILASTNSNPETEVFQTMLNTLKSKMAEFLQRAEQRGSELESMVHVYSFCEEAIALAREGRQYLEQVETEFNPAKDNLDTLKTYKDKLADCFSAQHFQSVKASSMMGSGEMRVWNAAWTQCQEFSQQLGETLKQWGDATHIDQQQPRSIKGEGEVKEIQTTLLSLVPASSSTDSSSVRRDQTESRCGNSRDSTHVACFNLPFNAGSKGSVGPKTATVLQDRLEGPGRRLSEADLKKGNPISRCEVFPWQHGALGRSLSEGSFMSSLPSCEGGSSPFWARQSQSRPLMVERHSPQLPRQVKSLDGNFCSGHSNCRTNVDRDDDRKDGDPRALSCGPFSDPTGDLICDRTQEALALCDTQAEENASNVLKLQRIMAELLLTEREYVRSLGYVREHYFPELDRADVPQDLRGQRGSVFGNLEKLHDFHSHHFLEELEGCLQEPFRVGRCFLRHKESFGLYALYSKNKPQSDSLLINYGNDFFKQKQLELGDKMDLSSYLLKPVQRISKYSLLLQDMLKECGPYRCREKAEVQHALEVIQFQLRHGNNLLAMDDIQDCDVNLKEQGQLIRQDEFLVSFRKKKCFRHVFLFQDLVLFSKTKRTDVGNDTYIYKQSFKTADLGMTHNSGDSGLCFEIWFRRRKSQDTYILQASSSAVKEAWTKDLEQILWDQAVHNREVRMQERAFMGIGNKPFMDIKPSDAAISDRAVNCALMGRESKALGTSGFPVLRPNSVGSGSCSSSFGSNSSSSSGRGSLSSPAGGYLCRPKQRELAGGQGHHGALEEDDLDQDRSSQNLLMDSSESSGESVSGFSSSGHSCHCTVGGEADDAPSLCPVILPRSKMKSLENQLRFELDLDFS